MSTVVENQREVQSSRNHSKYRTEWLGVLSYVLLACSIVLFAAIRFHLRNVPLERDGGEYAYMGQLMLQGIPPYKLAANMKLPGTYAAYAATMAVFGETLAGIHAGVIVVTSLSGIFLFLIGRRLYGVVTGAVAGACCVLFSARPGVLGIDGQATHFVVVTALAGLLILIYAMPLQDGGRERRGSSLLFLLSGLCFGLSFLMKQPGILFGIFGGIYWLGREWKHGILRREVFVRGAALIVGAVLPYAITCFLMLKLGIFHNFWFWTWTYARQYAGINGLSDGWRNFKTFFPWAVRPFAIWAIALIGLLSPIWNRWARTHAGFATGLFLASFIAVCPGLYFRPHYWIVLLPAGALCAGIAVEWATRGLEGSRFRGLVFAPLIVFAAVYATAAYGQWKAFYRLDPDALSRKMYDPGQDFPGDVRVTEFIKSRARTGDQIGILGSEPEICFYTHLRCATSYMYVYPLLEDQKYAKRMQSQMLRELESAPPRFVVYIDDSWSWNWKPTIDQNRGFVEAAWNFAHSGYTLVKQIPVTGDGEYTEQLWGPEPTFYIFERTGS